MSAQPLEPLPQIRPLDPASPEGVAATERLAVIHAGVIDRLRAEGKPVPGEPLDPSP